MIILDLATSGAANASRRSTVTPTHPHLRTPTLYPTTPRHTCHDTTFASEGMKNKEKRKKKKKKRKKKKKKKKHKSKHTNRYTYMCIR